MEEREIDLEVVTANHLDALDELSSNDNSLDSETKTVNMLMEHVDFANKLEQESEQFKAKMELENRKCEIEEAKIQLEAEQFERSLEQQKAENRLKKIEIGGTVAVGIATLLVKVWCKKKDMKMLDVVGKLEESGVWRTTASKISIGRIGRD